MDSEEDYGRRQNTLVLDEAREKTPKPAWLDWVLMPAISFLTVFVLLVPTEFVARKIYYESNTISFDCLVTHDSKNGIHAIPNSFCTEKTYESVPVHFYFNSCGNRADADCAPKAPGTYRIVLLGTSVAYGLRAEYGQTYAALLPKELTQKTGRKVELYDEGIMFGTPRLYDMRFKYILAAQPDLILWTITKFDIEHVSNVTGTAEFQNHADRVGPVRKSVAGGLVATGFLSRLIGFCRGLSRVPPGIAWTRTVEEINKKSRTLFMLKHFLYQSQSEYVSHSLTAGEEAAFLRVKPSPTWQDDLRQFDRYTADIEEKAKAAGVPLVVTVVPERAAAAMISMDRWPAGYDPYLFGEQVRTVVERHGGTYIDLLHGYRHIPNPEQYWFPVDKHPTAAGNAILSELLAKGLTNGSVPALDPVLHAQTSSIGGK